MSGSTGRFGHLRALTFAALAAAAFLVSQAPVKAAAAEPVATESGATAVVRAAQSHLGASYQRGETGPSRFDCSGLVYRVFADVGLAGRLGGQRSAAGLYHWFSSHHLASRTSPRVGDLVIWGGGVHVGIYIGHGRAISALTDGVRSAPVTAVLSGFTAYLHTHLASLRIAIAKAHTASTAVSAKVRHVTDLASLRTAPGTTHRRIATLRRGARLTVLGSRYLPHHRLWIHVRTAGGRTGWVASWLTHP